MQQLAEEATRKRPAQAAAEAPKRLKTEAEQRPSLTQLLARKAAAEPQLSLSQDSDAPLARVAAQQKAKRLKAKTQQPQTQTQQQGKTLAHGKTTEEGDVVFELSAKRCVTVRKWKAMKFVDIREFYDDNGQAKPGKKGGEKYGFSEVYWSAVANLCADWSVQVSRCRRTNGRSSTASRTPLQRPSSWWRRTKWAWSPLPVSPTAS